MDPRQLTARIREEAFKLDFSAVGVARAQPLEGERLLEWLERGFHGEMAYMATDPERRLDPTRLLPGVRSVISLAMLYRHLDSTRGSPDPSDSSSARGRISKYAGGTDYHLVVGERLEALAAAIRRLEPESRTKIYVDTGPILEKAWAVRAGLGWQGKNTNILNRRIGSWFFLGEILTDLELEYDEPVRDYCGSCTRCIDACPTGALEPYILDSRRCISYLTIELRGDTPEEHRQATGSWIFGCDICQDVCPWNRKSPFSPVVDLKPKPEVAENRLTTLARLTPEEFSQRYRRTAIKRSKWRGLMRNVAVALGNAGTSEAVSELERLLENEDSMLRRHAAWALVRIGSQEALQLLEKRKTIETDPETRETIESLLNRRDQFKT